MQQFQVPQFITVEDRIIGPLTLKQFFYLLGAGGAATLGFIFLPLFLFVVIAVPIALFFVVLAFGKVGDQAAPTIVSNALAYFLKPRLYLWRSPGTPLGQPDLPPVEPAAASSAPPPPVGGPLARGSTPPSSKLDQLLQSMPKDVLDHRL